MTHSEQHTPRRALVALGAAVLAAALVTGCAGDGGGGAAPEGWGTLDAKRLTVSFPKGFKPLTGAGLGKNNDAAAVLTQDGVIVAKIAVQTNFMQAGDVDMAALGARSTFVLGARAKSQKEIDVEGTDEARRVDYDTQRSNGKDNAPPEGTPIEGTDVVAMDAQDDPFLVRVIRKEGSIPAADIDKIIESVTITTD
ncbi:hypothetical protein [Streptomyces sp. NPDC059909]|uniref:hypothetical protein n=1 Tax=Streptomyces sp. NPDC059909 TaxID=3346998 RepID=UPI00366A0F72